MTTSLLRKIWQSLTEKPAPARQRLTGFESLEPRMVLSGFSAPMIVGDYFSPPPGNFSHIDRFGAEYANSASVEFGRQSDYNTSSAGMTEPIGPRFVGLVSLTPVATRDGGELSIFPGTLEHEAGIDRGSADAIFATSINLSTSTGEFRMAMSAMSTRFSDSLTLIDHRGDSDGGSSIATSSFRLEQIVSLSGVSTQSLGSSLSFTEIRAFPGSFSNSSDRREPRENIVEGAGGAPRAAALEAAFAHVTGVETGSRSSSSSATAIALVTAQSDGLRSSSASRNADGSTVSEQDQAQANQAAVREQSEFDEAYAMNRRGLKRKLPGDATALDEAEGEDAALIEEGGDSEKALLLENARQFDAAGNSGSQMPELALANFPADGLIDVLAADVDSVHGDAKFLDSGRLVLVEPAMIAYQAFEVVVDGDVQAEHRVLDAADVATVAMSDTPVVQAQ